MTRIALDTASASNRLALRRWLVAKGHVICPVDDTRAELVLTDGAPGPGGRLRAIPSLDPAGERIDFAALDQLLEEHALQRRRVLPIGEPEPGIVAVSAAMAELLGRVERLAAVDLPVLVTGESGSGKEVIARALHERGPRSAEPFVAVNCAAIPDTLFESELFGHERGSFTDATGQRIGHFERAGAGTLFLDEIAEIPGPIQAKLLRALQERSFLRVGGSEPVRLRARILSAAASELDGDPRFRGDLYHRVAGGRLRVPPLRDRTDDLPGLCRAILAHHRGHGITGIDASALELLAAFDWPGNVRQLENVLRQAAILANADVLDAAAIEAVLEDPGRAESQSLDTAIRSWATRLHGAGLSCAELREELLDRFGKIEGDLQQRADRPREPKGPRS